MRLVFVHGMRQEGKDADKLRKAWEDAMLGAWSKLGLHAPAYELHMPYYGDILEEAVKALRGGGNVLTRGGEAQSMSDTERALINEYRQALGVTDAQIDAEVATELVGRGAGNWGWVQGAARLLEKVPGVGSIVLNLVSQVDGYLERPHIAEAVDGLVRPTLLGGPTIVVAHSLGTIVSYKLLRDAGASAEVPLFLTLGSPLGIGTVKDRLGHKNLKFPQGVGIWGNGTDERDYVALHANLSVKPAPPQIGNHTAIENGADDAHLILDYLADEKVARALHAALSGTLTQLDWSD